MITECPAGRDNGTFRRSRQRNADLQAGTGEASDGRPPERSLLREGSIPAAPRLHHFEGHGRDAAEGVRGWGRGGVAWGVGGVGGGAEAES